MTNTAPDTWSVENGMLVCSGHPTGVMRTAREYENFVLHVEWMHTEPGGNSGMFLWSGEQANPGSPFPDGVEVQMLELDWVNQHKKDGVLPPIAYVHGELFGVGGVKTIPDTPRGERSMSIENRCKPRGEWNYYDEKKEKLIKLPKLKQQMPLGKIYLEAFEAKMVDDFLAKSADLYSKQKSQFEK